MATHFQSELFQDSIHLLGTSGGGTKYTVVKGQPIYVGTDGDSNANRVIPVSDISEHKAVGLSKVATADTTYTNGVAAFALFPCTVLTDNVASGAVPTATADNQVYINDDGEFSNADGGSSGFSYGTCEHVHSSGEYSGLYRLHLTGADKQ